MTESHLVEGRAKPLGRYPHLKRVGDFLFISGTSSRRPDNTYAGVEQGADGNVRLDIRAQTRAVLENIDALLREADSGLRELVDVTTFLVRMEDFPGYNEVYGEFFDFDGPTRTTVAVRELPNPNLLIEIKAMAYSPRNAAHREGGEQ
ncbi:RidA family protein [Arhodomonas sp. SL1]|uniref:RidA family protein n=1 Tax=Arhodomonas sp. SL1 TaxID=3425691 RepID=UPI003F884268